jgi:hypothetical protein
VNAKRLHAALQGFKRRRLQRPPARGLDGVAGKVADAFNDVVELNRRMAAELER